MESSEHVLTKSETAMEESCRLQISSFLVFYLQIFLLEIKIEVYKVKTSEVFVKLGISQPLVSYHSQSLSVICHPSKYFRPLKSKQSPTFNLNRFHKLFQSYSSMDFILVLV